mmetsp:Transcript_145696/g.405981  ORF Transcript_145696/g.405981 Transcript_145696/m.405981 type:complete len:274 (-) Transcript_145696:107-928(-)
MCAFLTSQKAVNIVAFNFQINAPHTYGVPRCKVNALHAPTLALGEVGVHALQHYHPITCFIATRTSKNAELTACRVIIARHEHLDFCLRNIFEPPVMHRAGFLEEGWRLALLLLGQLQSRCHFLGRRRETGSPALCSLNACELLHDAARTWGVLPEAWVRSFGAQLCRLCLPLNGPETLGLEHHSRAFLCRLQQTPEFVAAQRCRLCGQPLGWPGCASSAPHNGASQSAPNVHPVRQHRCRWGGGARQRHPASIDRPGMPQRQALREAGRPST